MFISHGMHGITEWVTYVSVHSLPSQKRLRAGVGVFREKPIKLSLIK